MRRVVYDVAVSRDGFIAAPNNDVSLFPQHGEHVEAYKQRLQTYDCVLMGRHTYEFGYEFGLPRGARAYPHMEHYIFSESISLPDNAEVNVVRREFCSTLSNLKAAAGGDIYLCGGGALAGLLAQNKLIDQLRLKIAPVIFGSGTPLFTGLNTPLQLQPLHTQHFANGVEYCELSIL